MFNIYLMVKEEDINNDGPELETVSLELTPEQSFESLWQSSSVQSSSSV